MSYQLGQIDTGSDEYFTEPQEPEARPRRRGLIAGAAALLVIGVFAGGLWFAYHQGLRHAGVGVTGDVPLIRADNRPTKVKPENPGGMEFPDRDKLIYTQKRAAVEHLLPPPEKPLPRPTAPPPISAVGTVPAAPAVPEGGSPGAAAVPPAQSPQPAAKPASAAKPAVAKATAPRGMPAQGGGARIQLGAVRSEEAAQHEWERIRRANPDLLGSLSATPVRADLGEKGVYYRIQTGPIADADRICGELKRRNVGCIIAR